MLAAAFQQNSLQRVQSGDKAEVAFDAVPGRIFKARVGRVLPAIAAGQFQATGVLNDFATSSLNDRAVAEIIVDDDVSEYQIPLGAAAQVAILTEHWHHLAMIRRILLRMRSWENYLYLEGH